MVTPTPEQYNPPLTPRGQLWRVLLAVVTGGLVWATIAPLQWREARSLFWLDVSLGVLAVGLSLLRRRWPLPITLIVTLLGAVSASSVGAGLLVGVSLATRKVVWQIVVVAVAGIAAGQVFPLAQPQMAGESWWVTLAFGVTFTVAMLVWGLYIGSRRELLWTLRDQVHRAESQQDLRVAQGRSNERARIAREMHDVLAHRISLITMHAGALAYRTDLSAEQVRETAELIQATSHEALADLRQVLGLLRSDQPDLRDRPQPTFGDLGLLILEAEDSGMSVRYDDSVRLAPDMPEQVGRTAYRIVQEGLTNARKHAAGATVLVRVTGSPDDGVDIRIRNPARTHGGATPGISSGQAVRMSAPAMPGAGLGLVGLGERALLSGGRLETVCNGGRPQLT